MHAKIGLDSSATGSLAGLPVLFLLVAPALGQETATTVVFGRPAGTANFDWQEAVSRIAAERQRVVVCAQELRKHADDEHIRTGGQLYEEARAELNFVIDALVKALADDQPAEKFDAIEPKLKLGVEKREALCDQASRWVPDTEDERDLLTEAGGFVRGLMIDAVAAIYGNASDEPLITRSTIVTSLEAMRLDDFETATGGTESVRVPALTPEESGVPQGQQQASEDDMTVPGRITGVDQETREITIEDQTFAVPEPVEVFFGTDRNNEGTPDAPRFGGERGGALSLGQAIVTVPKAAHGLARVERPGFLWSLVSLDFLGTFGLNENPAEHFTLQDIQLQNQADFTARLRERVGAAERFEKQAFVFVHGFNVGFDAAAYRAAQIAHDLKFDGAAILYSWPSRGGGIFDYAYDQNSAKRARNHLRSFLDLVRSRSGAEVVHLIAHSMGTDPLLEVLADLRGFPPESEQPLFNQVILAAPDLDRDVFLELAKEVRGVAEGITLYASSRDRALAISRIVAGGVPRAGDVPPGIGPVIDLNVETIDVSEIGTGTNFFNFKHSEYSDNPILLNDIGQLMKTGLRPPDKRLLALEERTVGTGRYWVYPRL